MSNEEKQKIKNNIIAYLKGKGLTVHSAQYLLSEIIDELRNTPL